MKSDAKKVLFVANNFDIAIYRFRKEVIQAFLKKNIEVSICTPFSNTAVEFCKYYNIKFYSLHIDRRGKNIFKDLILLFRYLIIIKKAKSDYIFSYTIKPNLYIGILNIFFKKKYYPNVTGLGSVFTENNLFTKAIIKLYQISFSSSEKVFFQNEANKNIFLDEKIIKANKAVLLPGSGVNLLEKLFCEYPKDDGMVRLLFLGRIMKDKGIFELIEAFDYLTKEYDNIYLEICGFVEEDKSKLRNLIKSNEKIQYSGFINDVVGKIKHCHVMVLPSYHEGLSNVLLEASSMGRPSIASDIPGCKEIVDDDISGMLCVSKDVESLIKSLKAFIDLSYSDKITMGKKSRDKVEQTFDRNIIIDKYLQEVFK